jgi:hypothetical protein
VVTTELPAGQEVVGELPAGHVCIPPLETVKRVWVLYAHQVFAGNKRQMAAALGISIKSAYNLTARYRRDGWLTDPG